MLVKPPIKKPKKVNTTLLEEDEQIKLVQYLEVRSLKFSSICKNILTVLYCK